MLESLTRGLQLQRRFFAPCRCHRDGRRRAAAATVTRARDKLLELLLSPCGGTRTKGRAIGIGIPLAKGRRRCSVQLPYLVSSGRRQAGTTTVLRMCISSRFTAMDGGDQLRWGGGLEVWDRRTK